MHHDLVLQCRYRLIPGMQKQVVAYCGQAFILSIFVGCLKQQFKQFTVEFVEIEAQYFVAFLSVEGLRSLDSHRAHPRSSRTPLSQGAELAFI